MTKITKELSESMNSVIIRPIHDELIRFKKSNNIILRDSDLSELFRSMEDLQTELQFLTMSEEMSENIKSILNANR